jgi:CDGSH-type Zn-finger protein
MTYHPDHDGFRAPHNPMKGGYTMLYHKGESNHCPGCGGTHWLVGRTSAECARCDTALPLAEQAHARLWTPQPKKPLLLVLFDRFAFPN